jgi:hypothetical protein
MNHIPALKRAAQGVIGIATVIWAISLSSCVQAQEASPHAFLQQQAAPVVSNKQTKGPSQRYASRNGRVIETGRWVTVALPPPPPFVRGRLVCAVNVNRYLAKLGKPTTGSAAAISFWRHGRVANRHTPGAVQISRRVGGHHAEVVAGGGLCWNPSASRQRWTLVDCGSRRNVMGWRLA